jgi:hypothetical protein
MWMPEPRWSAFFATLISFCRETRCGQYLRGSMHIEVSRAGRRAVAMDHAVKTIEVAEGDTAMRRWIVASAVGHRCEGTDWRTPGGGARDDYAARGRRMAW